MSSSKSWHSCTELCSCAAPLPMGKWFRWLTRWLMAVVAANRIGWLSRLPMCVPGGPPHDRGLPEVNSVVELDLMLPLTRVSLSNSSESENSDSKALCCCCGRPCVPTTSRCNTCNRVVICYNWTSNKTQLTRRITEFLVTIIHCVVAVFKMFASYYYWRFITKPANTYQSKCCVYFS